MTVIDQLKIIETNVPKENSSVEKIGNQSFKITFSCGFELVRHLYSDSAIFDYGTTDKQKELITASRLFFITLCKIHNNENNTGKLTQGI